MIEPQHYVPFLVGFLPGLFYSVYSVPWYVLNFKNNYKPLEYESEFRHGWDYFWDIAVERLRLSVMVGLSCVGGVVVWGLYHGLHLLIEVAS